MANKDWQQKIHLDIGKLRDAVDDQQEQHDVDHATFELNFEYADEEGYVNTAQGYARIELPMPMLKKLALDLDQGFDIYIQRSAR